VIEEAEEPRLRALAIVATRGTSNNLFQIATLVRAATALDSKVDVLFRDAALAKLRSERINDSEWSDVYSIVAANLAERLKAADFTHMETFLRDAKEHGDHVHYWACSETLDQADYALGDLTPLLDGTRSARDFELSAQASDALVSF
jgi:peroxiredoxin family protein